MTKNKLFAGAGRYWVETKDGRLGCVMDNGIVFKDSSSHMGDYDNNLINNYGENDIIRILTPRTSGYTGIFNDKSHFDIVSEVNQLIPITSLSQLEYIRKEICDKYDDEFYLSNKNGKWEIIYNGIIRQVGVVGGTQKEVSHITNLIAVGSCKNNTNAKCGDPLYFNWKTGKITDKLIKVVDLEKEGYILELEG